jgi:hypothetical protein
LEIFFRQLEEELLRPYRKDAHNIENLMIHCREIVQERKREIEARITMLPKVRFI